MRREEQNTQIAVVQFLDMALIPPAFVFHVPNGGWRTLDEVIEAVMAAGIRLKGRIAA